MKRTITKNKEHGNNSVNTFVTGKKFILSNVHKRPNYFPSLKYLKLFVNKELQALKYWPTEPHNILDSF